LNRTDVGEGYRVIERGEVGRKERGRLYCFSILFSLVLSVSIRALIFPLLWPQIDFDSGTQLGLGCKLLDYVIYLTNREMPDYNVIPNE